MQNFLTTSLLALGITLTTSTIAQSADPPSTGTLRGDAELIIRSKQDDVRLWAHPPRILVLGDDEVLYQVREIAAKIEAEIRSPFGDKFFGEITSAVIPDDFGAGQHALWVAMRKGGPAGWQVDLNLYGDPDRVLETDILVVVANRRDIAMINGLWGLSARDNRAMLQGGRSRCFYNSQSRNGIRYGALVLIFPDEDRELLDQCLWEELLHTLGPLRDAKGSPFFSFDDHYDPENQQAVNTKRANDILLIRALYESGAGPGGAPDIVLDYLSGLVAR